MTKADKNQSIDLVGPVGGPVKFGGEFAVASAAEVVVPKHKCSRFVCVTCGSDAPQPEPAKCLCCPVHPKRKLACYGDWCKQALGHEGPCDKSPFLR